jgi:hypothetical protein
VCLAVRELINVEGGVGVGGGGELCDEEQMLLGDRLMEGRMGMWCRTKDRYLMLNQDFGRKNRKEDIVLMILVFNL